MAVTRRHSFESGQSSGTTITGGNSATGGDAFDTVTIQTGAAVTYDSTAYRGSLSCASSTGASVSAASCNWTTFGSLPHVYGRAVINSASLTTLQDFLRIRAAGAQVFRLRLNTNGKIDFRSATGNSIIQTSTTVLSTSTWYLIRWDVVIGASAAGAIYIHTDPTSPTAAETLSTNTGSFGTTNADEFNIGAAIAALANVGTFRCDDIVLTDQGLPGPPTQSISISETLTGADSVARTLAASRAAAESLTAADTIARAMAASRAAAEGVTAGDSIARALATSRSAAETLGAADAIARACAVVRAGSESLGAVDATSRGLLLPRGVAESMTASDAVARSVATSRLAAESLAAADSASAASQFGRAAGETLALIDAVGRVLVLGRATAETLTAADAIAASLLVPTGASGSLVSARSAPALASATSAAGLRSTTGGAGLVSSG